MGVEGVDSATGLHAEVASREGRRRGLADISFDVGKGEFVSVMGRSGVGKTTLLRVLAGLLEPSPGSIVRLDGKQVTGPPEGVSLVFQDYTNSLLPRSWSVSGWRCRCA